MDPQAGEPCVEDPSPQSWFEETLSFETQGVGWVHAGLGGDVALMAVALESGLHVTTSVAGGAWTEPRLLSSTLDPFDRPLVRVGSDGKGALVLWAEKDDSVHYSTWSGGAGFAAPEVLEGVRALSFSSIDAVVLPQAVAVLAWGPSGGLHIIDGDGGHAIDSTAPGGLSRRLFFGSDEHAVLYVTPSFGLSSRYEYIIGAGFGTAEPVPSMAATPTAWQEFWFEGPDAAARVVRQWLTPETEGLHVTVRHGGQGWSQEERITNHGGEATTEPAVAAAGDELFVVWTDASGLVERGRVTTWSAQRPLARSRDVEIGAVVGTRTGAALVGNLRTDAFTKLFRRGQDGTWYCPRLARHGSNPFVTGESGGELLFAGGRGASVHVVRFRP